MSALRPSSHMATGLALTVGALFFLGFGVAQAELLFEDDFSSGDFSNHNEHFRWGRSGAIPSPGEGASVINEVPGPDGTPVKAMTFTYGTWQEVRFHLTESLAETRTESGPSNVAYPEIWIRYSMFVPANYHHRNTGGAGGHNNKGWFTMWKHAYQGGLVHSRIEWWPRSDGTSRPTLVPKSGGGHTWPAWRTPEHVAGSETYAFVPTESGSWVDYAFGVRLQSHQGAADHFVKVFKNGQPAMEWNRISFSGTYDLWTTDNNPANNGFDRGYIMGYHNSGYANSTIFYITDFRIGTSPESIGISVDPRPNAPELVVE